MPCWNKSFLGKEWLSWKLCRNQSQKRKTSTPGNGIWQGCRVRNSQQQFLTGGRAFTSRQHTLDVRAGLFSHQLFGKSICKSRLQSSKVFSSNELWRGGLDHALRLDATPGSCRWAAASWGDAYYLITQSWLVLRQQGWFMSGLYGQQSHTAWDPAFSRLFFISCYYVATEWLLHL